jgi:hypothetical protein
MRTIILLFAALISIASCRTLKHSEQTNHKDTASTEATSTIVTQAARDTSITRKDSTFTQVSVDTSKAHSVTETTTTERIYPDSTIRIIHSRKTESVAAGIAQAISHAGTFTQASGAATHTELEATHIKEATATYINDKSITDRTIPASRNMWPIIILIVLGIIIYVYLRYFM